MAAATPPDRGRKADQNVNQTTLPIEAGAPAGC
jgi:hypothetical protein